MVLIFHDEFPQPNEREQEMRVSKKGRELKEREREARRNSFAFAPLGLRRIGGVLSASLASGAPLSPPTPVSQTKPSPSGGVPSAIPGPLNYTMTNVGWQRRWLLLCWHKNEITCISRHR